MPPLDSMYENTLTQDHKKNTLQTKIEAEFFKHLRCKPAGIGFVSQRLSKKIETTCIRSNHIQNSGVVNHWEMTLIRHHTQKFSYYYLLRANQRRIKLHHLLSSMAYSHIGRNLNYHARQALLEDFLQDFYIETLQAFRREYSFASTYCPKTRVELAEYMAYSELYAKRKIFIQREKSKQLIVLRAQAFFRRQPPETVIDMTVVEGGTKSEKDELNCNSWVTQKVREKIAVEDCQPEDLQMREIIIKSLLTFLKKQKQSDCVRYLRLKIQGYTAPEIDEILDITPKSRDHLQQRCKYQIEKFSQQHEWELVHQWLEASLDNCLGMTSSKWTLFLTTLPTDLKVLIDYKNRQMREPDYTNEAIAKDLNWSSSKVKRNWRKILKLAQNYRN